MLLQSLRCCFGFRPVTAAAGPFWPMQLSLLLLVLVVIVVVALAVAAAAAARCCRLSEVVLFPQTNRKPHE